MRKRRQNDFWSDIAKIGLTTLGGYVVYRILTDNEPLVGQEANTIPSLDKNDFRQSLSNYSIDFIGFGASRKEETYF